MKLSKPFMTITTPPDAHLIDDEHNPELIKAKIVSETARINWLELQKFYAAGDVLFVSAGLDLIDVAFAIATNDQMKVAAWLSLEQIGKVQDALAMSWYQQQQNVWAVVVSPWVLVQLPQETTQ